MTQEQLVNVYVQSIYRFLRDKKMLIEYYDRHFEAIKRGNARHNKKLMEAIKLEVIRRYSEFHIDIPRVMFNQIYTKGFGDCVDISYTFETYNIRKLGYKIRNDR